MLKDENPTTVKKEIRNTIEQNAGTNTDFLKKTEKKAPLEEIVIEDDGGDWSAVPAFLRRNKK